MPITEYPVTADASFSNNPLGRPQAIDDRRAPCDRLRASKQKHCSSISFKDDLVGANAWLGTALNLQLVLGPVVAGVVVGAVELTPAFLLNSHIPRIGPSHCPPDFTRHCSRRVANGFMGDVRNGISALQQHPVARAVFVTLFFGVAFAAVDNVALVFLVRELATRRCKQLYRAGV